MQKTALLIALILLLAALSWIVLTKDGGATVAADLLPESAAGESSAEPASPELIGALDEPAQSTAELRAAHDGEQAGREDAVHAQEFEPPVQFEGQLVSPAGESIGVAAVRATLTAEDGSEFLFEQRDCETLRFEPVPGGVYELRVEAAGYSHRLRTVDLLTISQASRGRTGAATWSERVTLWPASWIPIVIRTRDGRPFRALAEDLDLHPKKLFVHAFRVEASRDGFGAAAQPSSLELDPAQMLARSHPVGGYQSYELPGAIACSLEVLAQPPFFVGLWIHGIFYQEQILLPGAQELLFEIDMQALDAGLASLRMRLVDRDSGEPVLDARGTLKADTSAHRRSDLSDVAPAAGGQLLFKRVIPGQHELAIQREGSLVQRRVQLEPGQHLDLGDIPLASGPGLQLRVVDQNGKGVHSALEIAPFKMGGHADALFPPNLHRFTDPEGMFMMPIPEALSIVRARPIELDLRNFNHPQVGSRNYIIDPSELPTELVILAQVGVDMGVEPAIPWIAGHAITCEDEHGIIVSSARAETVEKLHVSLVPGTYLIKRWEGEREVGRLDVLIKAGNKVMRCP